MWIGVQSRQQNDRDTMIRREQQQQHLSVVSWLLDFVYKKENISECRAKVRFAVLLSIKKLKKKKKKRRINSDERGEIYFFLFIFYFTFIDLVIVRFRNNGLITRQLDAKNTRHDKFLFVVTDEKVNHYCCYLR